MRREEKLRESMLKYLDGSIPKDELERLNQAVENDWAARHEMAELMLQDVLLTRMGKEEFFDLDVPAPAPPPRRASSCTTSRIIRIHKEHAPAPEPAPRRPVWPGIAIAAAALFAVSVGVAVKGQDPVAPAPVSAPERPVLTSTPPAPEVKPQEPPPAPPAIRAKMLREPAPKKPVKPRAVTKKPPPPAAAPKPSGPTMPDGVMTLPVPEPLPPPPPPKAPSKTPPKTPPKPKEEKK